MMLLQAFPLLISYHSYTVQIEAAGRSPRLIIPSLDSISPPLLLWEPQKSGLNLLIDLIA